MEHQIRGQMMGTDANEMVRVIKDRLYPSCSPIANQYLARARISIFALFCVISIFLCYVLLTATVYKSRGFIWAKLDRMPDTCYGVVFTLSTISSRFLFYQ